MFFGPVKCFVASEFLQPFKARPETSSLAANRRICAVLGVKNPMSSEKAKLEREKLEAARSKTNFVRSINFLE